MYRYVFICLTISCLFLDCDGCKPKREQLLPSFEVLNKNTDECDTLASIPVELCMKVIYVDGSNDLILGRKSPRSEKVVKGKLKSNGRKVVIIRQDQDNPEDTIVFKSGKTGTCTRFSVDLLNQGTVSCLNDAPQPDEDDMDEISAQRNDMQSKASVEMTRRLDPHGYRLNVAVYYDDMFKSKFGRSAETRIEAIMSIVDQMYSEKDTLTTEIEVNLVAIEHAKGSNWGNFNWQTELTPWSKGYTLDSNDLSNIAKNSPHFANLYVFITGKCSIRNCKLGLSNLDSVCNTDREYRININQYVTSQNGGKGGDAYTAETIAHEIGHNIGMDHDCKRNFCNFRKSNYEGPKILDGVECYGYMDYNSTTIGWSPCSVVDLTLYMNKMGNKFCLTSLVQCENGWSMFRNACYKVGNETTDWYDAERTCNELGAHLTSIHSQEEADFLLSLQHSLIKDDDLWIGGHRNGNDFQWIDGTTIDYTNWSPNEPNNDNGNENCIDIFTRPGMHDHAKWNDLSCNFQRKFLCKKQIGGGLIKPDVVLVDLAALDDTFNLCSHRIEVARFKVGRYNDYYKLVTEADVNGEESSGWSSHLINGRGVYRGINNPYNCIWWHSYWRHWWMGECKDRGGNDGFAYLNPDETCPQDGSEGEWRNANDKFLKRGKVTGAVSDI